MLALFIALASAAVAASKVECEKWKVQLGPDSAESTIDTSFRLPASIRFIDEDAFEGTAISEAYASSKVESEKLKVGSTSSLSSSVEGEEWRVELENGVARGFVQSEKTDQSLDCNDLDRSSKAAAGSAGQSSFSVHDPALEAVFRLPAYLEFIAEEAFAGTAAEAVVLPETVTEIGDRAFAEMPRLVAINIPDSVFEIGHDAFDVPRRIMVFGSANGPAGRYAAERGMPFVPTDAAAPEPPRQMIAERQLQETPTAIDLIIEESDDATVEVKHQRYKPIIIARCIDRPELNHQTRLFP